MSNTGPAQTGETLSTDAQRVKERVAQALLISGYVRPIEWAREVADAVMTVVAPLLAGARHPRGHPGSGPVADGWLCRDCGHPDSPFQSDDSWQCEQHRRREHYWERCEMTTDYPAWVDEAIEDITTTITCAAVDAEMAVARVLVTIANAITDGFDAGDLLDVAHRMHDNARDEYTGRAPRCRTGSAIENAKPI